MNHKKQNQNNTFKEIKDIKINGKSKNNIEEFKEEKLNLESDETNKKKLQKKNSKINEIKALLNIAIDSENESESDNNNMQKESQNNNFEEKIENIEYPNLSNEEKNIFINNFHEYESEESNNSKESSSENINKNSDDNNNESHNLEHNIQRNSFKDLLSTEKKELIIEKKNSVSKNNIELENAFKIGKNIQKEKEKDKIEIGKLCSGFIDNKLVTIIDDKLYYNGLEYNKYTGRYIKKEYKKENIIQFKCKNHRKDERHRKGLGNFCNSEIILQISNQNNITDQKFIMIKDHSEECKNLEIINPKLRNEINKWDEFRDKCINYMEKADNYENKFLINEFHKIFDKGSYDFEINDKKLVNIIRNWKRNSIKFTQYCIFEESNIINSEEELFLREFKYFYTFDEKKSKSILNKYAIWIDDLNISHLRESKHIFIDGTWYRPNGYEQILIVLYKDIIIKEKIPGCYVIMNNKRYDNYKEVFISIKNILTQNELYSLNIETITTDSEKALIKAIYNIFPKIKHFNCYYHYKQDLIRNFKKAGLYKKNSKDGEKNECKNVINELGLLPINYNGDINYIINSLNEIVENYPNFKNIIEKYFKRYKMEYFINGDYNYSELPIDCRSNSYLENYNLFIKQNLGRKYKLRWDIFIKFLKSESERIRNKLTKNTESNLLQKAKNTKFGLEKYTEKLYETKMNISENKFFITNFQWLQYSNNSCRYDVFATLYIFCLYDYIQENMINMNTNIKNIHSLMSNIKINPNNDGIKALWLYCIKNKIDVERTEINNIDNVVNSGFGLNGAIVQLFAIFKNEENFCIKEKRQEVCQICNNIKEFEPSFHSHLIIIDEAGLNMNTIELNIYYSLVYEGLMPCNKCKLGINFPSARITYEIVNYPKFLFVLFDMRSYQHLKLKKDLIKKLCLENINLTENDHYKLKCSITCPSYNHFTIFINKLNSKVINNELELNKNYYYDDNEFNGNFQMCRNLDIEEIFNNNIFPYLLVYEKI